MKRSIADIIMDIEDRAENKIVDFELAIEGFIVAPRKPTPMSPEMKRRLTEEWDNVEQECHCTNCEKIRAREIAVRKVMGG